MGNEHAKLSTIIIVGFDVATPGILDERIQRLSFVWSNSSVSGLCRVSHVGFVNVPMNLELDSL